MTSPLWTSYNDGTFTDGIASSSSIAAKVLSSCGISASGFDVGGALKHVDIKHMDALTAIKASLFESLATSSALYEIATDSKGDIVCKEIGSGGGGGSTDVYYSVQSSSYSTAVASVMVTGQDPLPERKLRSFTDVLNSNFHKRIWDSSVINSGCTMPGYKQYAIITYSII